METVSNPAGPIYGIVVLVVAVFLLVLAIAWLILPFILMSKLDKMTKHLAAIESELSTLRYIETKSNREGEPPAS